MTYADLVEWQDDKQIDDATLLRVLCDLLPDAIEATVAAIDANGEVSADGGDE